MTIMMGVRTIGFTGTREGLTPIQGDILYGYMHALDAPKQVFSFHHGCCVGADAQAHAFARRLGWWVFIHPPKDPKYQAMLTGEFRRMPEEHYMLRNVNILNAVELLIACPKGPEAKRSGTWATVRYAREKMGSRLKYVVIWPDGLITSGD